MKKKKDNSLDAKEFEKKLLKNGFTEIKPVKDINWLDARLSNQLRIHWKWLKDSTHEDLTKFIMAIIKNNNITMGEKKYSFELDENETKKFEKWKKKQMKKNDKLPTAGERFQFSFIPTGFGMITEAKDLLLNETIDLTDFDNW